MVKMFEISMEVIMNDAFTEKQVRDVIIDTLRKELHPTHVQAELSEKKCKDWIVDRDLYWGSPKKVSIDLMNWERE